MSPWTRASEHVAFRRSRRILQPLNVSLTLAALLLLLLMAVGPKTARAVEEPTSDIVLVDAGGEPEQQQYPAEEGDEIGAYEELDEEVPAGENATSGNAEAVPSEEAEVPLEVMDTGATSGTCGENLQWSYADGTLTITGSGALRFGTWTAVPWYTFASEITSVSLPAELTTIGDYAFSGCKSLSSINLPKGLTSIGNCAFCDCSSLTSLVIPETVTYLGYRLISGTAISEMVVPASVTGVGTDYSFGVHWGPLTGASNLKRVTFADGMIAIPEYMLYQAPSVESVTIPSSVTSIGAGAFLGCSSLASVDLPAKLSSIGDATFSGCSSLASVTLPQAVTSIDHYAFSGCKSLSSINLPNGLTFIGDRAFSGCSSLVSLDIPATVTHLGRNFVNGTVIAELTVPASVASVGHDGSVYDGPLSGASSLKRVSFADGMGTIPAWVLSGASSVESVTIPSSVASIGDYAFYNCAALPTISLPKGLTSVGYRAFYGCSSLASITIPQKVTSIGGLAFCDCSSLTSVILPGGLTSIGAGAFYGCSSLASVDLPAKLSSIGDATFSGCSSLASVTLPQAVTSIGHYALRGCSSLASVSLPGGLIRIGVSAFSGCSGLKDVYYYGNVNQEKWFTISKGRDNDPLLAAKLHLVKAPVVGSSYGILQYEQSKADDIKWLAKDYVSAADAYIAAVQRSADRNARKIERSGGFRAHGKVLEEADAPLETFTPDLSLSAAWKNAAYEGLARYYDDCAKIGENLTLGSIDMSADVISVSTSMVKTIRFFMGHWESREYDVDGKTVEINMAGQAGAAHVGAVYVNDSYAGMICSSPEDTAKAMTAYLNELKKWDQEAIHKALTEVVEEFTSATGISEWTKGKLTKLFKNKLAFLDQLGLGDVHACCTQMRKGYDAVHTLICSATTDDAVKALHTPDALAKSLNDLVMDPDSVSDAAVNAALKQVDSAKDALVNALREYATDKIENKNQMGFRDVVDSVLGGISKTYKKYFVQCPVDVFVYDSSTGAELGRIANGEVDYVDGIVMALNGDVKTIGIPDDIDARIKVVGTGAGTMTYVVEQVEDGKVTGRANWYDLPLEQGAEYAQDASADPLGPSNVPALVTNGESVELSEYVAVSDEDAHVRVEVQAGEGGVALGDEYHVFGSPVTLMALPDDGYVFDGWYRDNTLVATTSTYRFPAREDVSLQARFSFEAAEDEAYTVVMSPAYKDQCALVVRSRADGLNDLVALMDDFGDDAPSLLLRTYAGMESAATVRELPCDEEEGFALIAQGIDLTDDLRADVMLPDGSVLGSIYREGGLEAFADGIPVSMLSVSVNKQRYSGKKLEPKPTVKLGNTTLTVGADYTLAYENNVDAGTGVVRIKGMGDYCGEREVTFKIEAAANPITAKADKASVATTYKAGSATTLAKNVTTSMAQGAVTYANASTDAAAKKLIVNKATGQVTVPKATQAGTHTIKIKVTAAGNANYQSKSVIVTYNVVVSKANNPMKVKAVARKAKQATLKKKTVTVATPLKFTKKAQGKVTYAKVAKGSSKNLSIKKSTGKVTVKKGTKKGTYTIKVKVTASGNANYKAKSQTVTCKVKVK